MSIQKRFKEERLRLGLGCTKLSELAGVGRKTVYNWETSRVPNAEDLVKLDGLGFDVLYIVTSRRANNLEIIIHPHDRIKEERERLNMTQTEFSGIANSSKHAQITWERGRASPNLATLIAWHNIGVDTHYIITGERLEEFNDESI